MRTSRGRGLLDGAAAPAHQARGVALADLEPAEVERREHREGRDEDHQPAGPADQRAPQMQRLGQQPRRCSNSVAPVVVRLDSISK